MELNYKFWVKAIILLGIIFVLGFVIGNYGYSTFKKLFPSGFKQASPQEGVKKTQKKVEPVKFVQLTEGGLFTFGDISKKVKQGHILGAKFVDIKTDPVDRLEYALFEGEWSGKKVAVEVYLPDKVFLFTEGETTSPISSNDLKAQLKKGNVYTISTLFVPKDSKLQDDKELIALCKEFRNLTPVHGTICDRLENFNVVTTKIDWILYATDSLKSTSSLKVGFRESKSFLMFIK